MPEPSKHLIDRFLHDGRFRFTLLLRDVLEGFAQGQNRFGDVGFELEVGEIGMADYDPEKSQYGWHIIKRLE